MSDDLARLRAACVVVQVGARRGTGYLVTPDLVVTCAHVIQGAQEPIRLHFAGEERLAEVERQQPEADCALLKLNEPVSMVQPLSLAHGNRSNGRWMCYGFPTVTDGTGLVFSGEVLDLAGTIDGQPSVVLRSDMIAAGSSMDVRGLSGAPVLAQGQIIGHLKRLAPNNEEGRAAFGVIFACPARAVLALMGSASEALGKAGNLQVNQPSFQAPGSRYDANWYVHRWREEREAINLLRYPGAPVVLAAPDGFGKSWMLSYLIESLRNEEQEDRFLRVNLSTLDSHARDSLDQLLRELAIQLVEAIDGPDAWVDEAWRRPVGGPRKLSRLMEQRVLPGLRGRLVLAIDSADAIGQEPQRSELFSMLRTWATKTHDPAWSSLRLLMTVTTSPARLIESVNQSPFNLAPTISLSDLDRDQVMALAERYGLVLQHMIINRLMERVGGHPYLLRLVMYSAALHEQSVLEILDSGRVFHNYLGHFRRWLTAHPKLHNAFMAVVNQRDIDEDAAQSLMDAGLIIHNESGCYEPRYPLYRNIAR